MSETFINEIITNMIAAAIALATGSVEGEGQGTAEPQQEPQTQVRTIRAYEMNATAILKKTELNLPACMVFLLKKNLQTELASL